MEAQGGTWDESRAKKTVKQARAAAKTSSHSNGNNNSVKGFPKSTSSPTFQNNGAANYGGYSAGGGYQSGECDLSSGSYQNGPSTNLTFADKKKMENSTRPADLRPSGTINHILTLG